MRQSLLTKADFWAYEEEWRLLEIQGPGGPYSFDPRFLDGIVLGPRISDANRDFIMGVVAERAVPTEVMEARIHPEVFRIMIASVDRRTVVKSCLPK